MNIDVNWLFFIHACHSCLTGIAELNNMNLLAYILRYQIMSKTTFFSKNLFQRESMFLLRFEKLC